MLNRKLSSRGFTLIEIMVAVSIFAIVALIATGALLTANRVNQRAQAIKLAMDNINFALDMITYSAKTISSEAGSGSCVEGVGGVPELIFNRGSADELKFSLDGNGHLLKDSIVLTADNINITNLCFHVSSLSSTSWPKVIIDISGEVDLGRDNFPFSFHTTATKRDTQL